MLHRLAARVFAVGMSSSHGSVCAADFLKQPADAYGPVSGLIEVEIKVSDFERFQAFLLQPGNLSAHANYVWLDSRGGDLPEAMKFANLLDTPGHPRCAD